MECVFFHKPSRTLLVTDLVVYIPKEPIEVIPKELLLDLARNDGLNTLIAGDLTPEEVKERTTKGPIPDTLQNRRIGQSLLTKLNEKRVSGWARSVLLVLYFQPFSLLEPDASFEAVRERWLVSPVLRSLVYNSIPKSCSNFVTRIEKDWNFKQILPCHLAGPVRAKKGDLSNAFRFSFEAAGQSPSQKPLSGNLFGRKKSNDEIMQRDNGTLDSLIGFLRKIGAVYEQLE